MDIGAILLLLAVLIGVGLYLAAPLMMNRRSRRVAEESQASSSLLAERDRVVTLLQELDFDYKLGKIPEEDYPTQRNDLLKKGADILKQLDTLKTASSSDDEAEARIEKAAAARRADAAAVSTSEPVSDDDLESLLASRRKERGSKSAGFCPRCGKPVLTTDKFCPNCGKAIN